MLIAFANVCKERDVNFQRDILFIGQDIDPVVARMCYISMSLLGMAGYVIVGNTLLMDTQNWDYWFTPMYFIHGFQWRRQRSISSDGCDVSNNEEPNDVQASMGGVPTALEKTSKNLPKTADTPEYNETKMGQFSLF